MTPRTYLYIFLLMLFPQLCLAADWKLVKSYKDMEVFFDTYSIQRIHNEVQLTVLMNYLIRKEGGKGYIKSKVQIQTVNCEREELHIHYATEYSDFNASGKILYITPLENVVVETEPETIAGEIYEAVCKLGT